MPLPVRYVVGLGSNLGDRLGHLGKASQRIARLGPVLERSAVYESAAWGGPDQGPFLNAALTLQVTLDAGALLAALLEIEGALGRERRERWGPRTIDLDVLWGDGVMIDTPGLRIPHERLTERTFALRPLLDLVPDAGPPEGGEPYAVTLSRLSEPAVVRVFQPSRWA
ncbi:MAG: 2-amino-4-hydroxy-6-hydroxymethyldihydropteridine diphosphokinase [Myxococcales bacterium]|nr:2-amino-4-hydroxy-6-hydroxymethyldihydropteridine diphosphokinase [Myxococcales bacterium]